MIGKKVVSRIGMQRAMSAVAGILALSGMLVSLSAILMPFVAAAAPAQDYPNRPVRLIIPWVPGGTTDSVGRILGKKLTEYTGQQWVIDNRGGATGTIGHALAAKAPPDGYTLLLGTNSTFAMAPHVYSNLRYDNDAAFAPISRVAFAPAILAVHPSLPVKSVKEFIGLAKSRPGQIMFSISGHGSTSHLAAELLMSMTDIRMTNVPYRGGTPAAIALVGGEVAMSFVVVSTALPHIKAGLLRPLGTSSAQRTSLMPELPAISETVPGFELVTSYGMFAPAATPRDIIARLNRELIKVLGAAEVRAQLEYQGVESVGGTPEDLALHQKQETAKWGKFIRERAIKFD